MRGTVAALSDVSVLCNARSLLQSIIVNNAKLTQKACWKISGPKVFLSLCRTADSTESRKSKGNFNKQGALLAGICVIILLKNRVTSALSVLEQNGREHYVL